MSMAGLGRWARCGYTVALLLMFLCMAQGAPSMDVSELIQKFLETRSVNGSDPKPGACETKCPTHVQVPKCRSLKMAPNYDTDCDCLMEYVCCPSKCPQVDNGKCKEGSFGVPTKDCCDCPDLRCDPCPKVDLPSCNEDCETVTFEETDTGCKIPQCKQSCPPPVNPVCKKCEMSQSYVNGSMCGCEMQRCVPKPCPEVVKLDAAHYPCQNIKASHDDCGCPNEKPVRDTYCDVHNSKAKTHVCTNSVYPNICFKNTIKEKSDKCGCDESECVQVDEKCIQEYDSEDCPKNHFMMSGLTQCGRARDSCIKCPDNDISSKNCDPKCNTVVEKVDSKGCLIRTCQQKACPKGSDCVFLPAVLNQCDCMECLAGTGGVSVDDGKNWIVIQRRFSTASGFNKNWSAYKNGFGSPSGNFWYGLEKIHKLTTNGKKWQLILKAKFTSGSYSGKWGYAIYNGFSIGSEDQAYVLQYESVDKYYNVKNWDSLAHHKGRKFTTVDRDNDASASTNCASSYGGAWWFGSCFNNCLNCDQRKNNLWNIGTYLSVSETEMGIRPFP